MASAIYKPGQGYWTRFMSAIAYGTLVAMGAVWVWGLLANTRLFGYDPIYTRGLAVILIFTVFGLLGYYLIGRKPGVVDFMIATEAEMKKVNWTTRREIIGSTMVVIGMTVVFTVYIGVLDLVFYQFFQWVKVLETTSR